MRPKADAAWNLHQLTRQHDLREFVLFSAGAATFGAAGQGNYAAANTFLEALAAARRATHLPAVSLAWGPWTNASGMTGRLSESDRPDDPRRDSRADRAEGMALFDLALARDEPLLVPVRLDVVRLRARTVRGEVVPALWHGLTGATATPSPPPGQDLASSLRQRLAGMSRADQEQAAVDLVGEHVAAVLGHRSADKVAAGQAFRDMGFDSLTAVELRNRLGAATGLGLPATLVFDYPTVADLAASLTRQLAIDAPPQQAPAPQAAAVPPAPRPIPDLIVEACYSAIASQQLALVYDITMGAMALRPKRSDPAAFRDHLNVIELSPDATGNPLVCICPAVAVTSPDVYLRLGLELAGLRQVSALVPPGFAVGDDLPATAEVMTQAMADAVLRHVGDRPYSLAGTSSGGLLGFEIAREAARRGRPPTGVILLDTYRMHDPALEAMENYLVSTLLSRHQGDGPTFENLTAATWICRQLFDDWEPTTISVPSLLARASEPLIPSEGDSWRTKMDVVSDQVDLRGNHFSIMDAENIADTAAKLDRWITGIESGSRGALRYQPNQ